MKESGYSNGYVEKCNIHSNYFFLRINRGLELLGLKCSFSINSKNACAAGDSLVFLLRSNVTLLLILMKAGCAVEPIA